MRVTALACLRCKRGAATFSKKAGWKRFQHKISEMRRFKPSLDTVLAVLSERLQRPHYLRQSSRPVHSSHLTQGRGRLRQQEVGRRHLLLLLRRLFRTQPGVWVVGVAVAGVWGWGGRQEVLVQSKIQRATICWSCWTSRQIRWELMCMCCCVSV